MKSLLGNPNYLRNYFIATEPKQATQECCEKHKTEYSKMVQKNMPIQSMSSIQRVQLQVQFAVERFAGSKVEVIPSCLYWSILGYDANFERAKRNTTG